MTTSEARRRLAAVSRDAQFEPVDQSSQHFRLTTKNTTLGSWTVIFKLRAEIVVYFK